MRWEWVLFVAVLAFFRRFVGGMLSKPVSRERLAAVLRHDTFGRTYRGSLEWALDRLDGWVTPADRAGLPPTDPRHAWTWKLYDRCLLLAVVYPILILFAVWAVSGAEGRIGTIVVLEGEVPAWKRAAAIGGLAIAILLIRIAQTRRKLMWQLVFGAVAFVVGLLIIGAVGVVVENEVAFVLGFAFLPAVLGTVVFTVVVTFAGEAALASVGAFAFAVAVASTSEVALIVPVAVAVAVAFVFLVNRGRPVFAYTLLTGVMAGQIVATVVWSGGYDNESGGYDNEVASAKVFLAVLPLTNALFDFASIGLTRWALRHGLQDPGKGALKWAAIDLAAAALLFLVLKLAVLLAVIGLNAAAGGGPQAGLVDLPAFLADLRANPQDYWWLYLGFLTTLLPTVLHGVVAVISLGPALSRKVTGRWARLVAATEADWLAKQEVYWGVSLWLALSFAAPIILLWWIYQGLRAAHLPVGKGLLWLAEGVARTFGAL